MKSYLILIITSFFFQGFKTLSQVENYNNSFVRFNLSADEETYKCSNPGCKNSFKAVVPTKVNSIENGKAEYVIAVVYYMIDNAKDLVGIEREKECNNYNYKSCNYVKLSEKTLSENIEIDAATLQYEDVSYPVNRVCYDVAAEIVKNFLNSGSQASKLCEIRIQNENK